MSTRPPQVPIAIVGLGALLPGSTSLAGAWRDIVQGRDLLTDVPPTHWLVHDYYDPDPAAPDRTYAKRGGFLPDVPFDPVEFGVPPSIVPSTDSAQLLALMVAQRALEDASGGDAARLDRERMGCVLGVTSAQELFGEMNARLQRPVWVKALREAGLDEERVRSICDRISGSYVPWQESTFPGLLGNVVAGRIANRFDLRGTNAVTDAACASSLAAISMAVNELRLGQADFMLAGGVDAMNDPLMFVCFSKTPALSPTGDCRPFSDAADGTMLGEGVVIFALKRLADAERDGDRVYAVIRGVGSSSDGRAKSVYAPLAEGQARALRRAYEAAGYGPETVELVEAHGTGTKAGDAAEVEGLGLVFGAANPLKKQWCALGSIKSQVGHTKAAAGAAGLLKITLALHHKVLPPTIKVERPNPRLGLEDSPFYVNTRSRPWVRDPSHPRRASVSSFGFGGSNFHVTAEEYLGPAPRPARVPATAAELFVFGAENVAGLAESVRETAGRTGDFAAIAHDVRAAFDPARPARLAVVASSFEELEAKGLAALANVNDHSRSELSTPDGTHVALGGGPGGIGFLFPGQGSQYVGMGGDLAMAFERARAPWDAAAATAFDGLRLQEVVFPPPAFDEAAKERQRARLTATEWAQPAMGATSLSMLGLLEALGVRPEACAGHSFGELSALHAAGVFEADALLRIARRRGELMRDAAATPGAMTAVSMPAAELRALVDSWGLDVVLANHNGPAQAVLSGPTAAIAEAERRLRELGRASKRLPVATAFHSPVVAGSAAPFAEVLAAEAFAAPRCDVYANATAAPYPRDPAAMRELLASQLVRPVRFVEQVEAMYAAGIRTFIEVGPSSVLTELVGRILAGRAHVAVSLDRRERDGVVSLQHALGRLAVAGVPMRFESLWPAPVAAWRRSRSGMTIPVNGANAGRPYPPKGGAAALPPPNAVLAGNPVSAPVTNVNGGSRLEPEAASRAAVAANPGPRAIRDLSAAPGAMSAAGTETGEIGQAVTNVNDHSHSSPAPEASLAWLRAFEEMQRQTAEAHAAYQRAAAESHVAFLRASEASMAALAAAAGAESGVVGSSGVAASLAAPIGASTVPAMNPVARAGTPSGTPSARTGPAAATALGAGTAIAPEVALATVSRPAAPVAATPRPSSSVMPAGPVAATIRPSTFITPGDAAHGSGPRSGAQAATTSSTRPAANARVSSPVPANVNDHSRSALAAELLSVVAEKTGYPPSMLGLDQELEADLGIDSIKRVEILSTLRERRPDLADVAPAELGRLKTLGQILGHLAGDSAATAGLEPLPPAAHRAASGKLAERAASATAANVNADSRSIPPAASGEQGGSLADALVAVVAEKTGYAPEMLAPHLELEADLGIDSIKRVEILSALREVRPDLPELSPSELGRLKTLGQIVAHLSAATGNVNDGSRLARPGKPLAGLHENAVISGDSRPRVPPPSPASIPAGPSNVNGHSHSDDPTAALMAVVAEKTGYPVDVLNPALELEADLGIDSIKRVEILSALRERWPQLPEVAPAELGRLRTLGLIASLLRGEAGPRAVTAPLASTETAVEIGRFAVREAPARACGLGPAALRAARRLVVTRDASGVSAALVAELGRRGIAASEVAPDGLAADVDGVIHLAGLDAAVASEALAASRQAFCVARSVAPRFSAQGGLFVVVQDTGGDFGLGGANVPWIAGLSALARTAAREWPRATVKAIDLERGGRDAVALARALADELELGGTLLEVGLHADGRRTTVGLEPTPKHESSFTFARRPVLVVSGGARGVTAESLVALARAAKPRLLVLGRTPLEAEPAWARGVTDEAALRRAALEEGAQAGRHATPADLAASASAVRIVREIRANLARLEAAGAEVSYAAVDVQDAEAVGAALGRARAAWGPFTGLVHGAGVLADKLLADKTDAQFARVFDTKVLGLQALLAATAEDPLETILLFSSIAARTGNPGQADYAMANEVLNAVAASEAARRPGCVVRSLGWGPWDGGMVGPGLRAHFEREGVGLVPLERGSSLFAEEFGRRGDASVVIADTRTPRTNAGRGDLAVHVSARTHPELGDHRLGGVPVVPVAMAAEWLLRAAADAMPGTHPRELRDLRVLRGIRLEHFDADGDLLYLRCRPGEGGALHAELRGAGEVLHYTATIDVNDRPVSAGPPPLPALAPWTRTEPYDGHVLFHGPRFRVLSGIDGASASGLMARLDGLAGRGWRDEPWVSDPAAVDGVLQAAVLWAEQVLGGASLPMAVRSLRLADGGPLAAPARVVIHARDVTRDRATCDAWVVNVNDRSCFVLEGIELVLRPGEGRRIPAVA